MKLKYFTEAEHACRCGCGRVGITQELGEKLDKLRDIVGRPLVITSGYRCPDHPIERKKAKAGTHAQGIAVDIRIKSLKELAEIVAVARSLGFNGLGIHQSFVHIDLRKKRMWWPY